MYHNITQAAAQASVWALKRISEPIWAEERINITVQIPESTRKTICTEMNKPPEKSCESWYCWSTVFESASSKWTSKNGATIIYNNCPESLQHPVKTKCKWSRCVYFVLALALIYSIWYGVQSESKAPAQVQLPRPSKLWNSEQCYCFCVWWCLGPIH